MIAPVRDYSRLRHEMLTRLAELFPAWTGAGGADADPDAAIVLVEAVAAVGDVLNLYHRARVRESFVTTAQLPQSVAELTALLGYRPLPAASAVTLQAFILKGGERGTVPAGFAIKAQGRPGRPELTFETATALEADAERNTLRLAGWNRSSRRLNGIGFAAVDALVLDQAYGGLKAGTVAVFTAGTIAIPVKLTAITTEDGRRRIHWNAAAIPAGANLALADLIVHARPKQSMPLAGRARADELTAGDRGAALGSPAVIAAGHRVLISSEGFLAAARILTKSGANVTWNRTFPVSLRRSATFVYTGGATPFAADLTVRAGAMRLLHGGGVSPTAAAQPGDYIVLSDAIGEEMVLVAGYASSVYQLATPVPRAMNGAALYRVRLDDPSGTLPGSAKSALAAVTIGPHITELTLDRAYEGLAADTLVVVSDGTTMRAARLAAVEVDDQNRTRVRFTATLGATFDVATLSVIGPFETAMRADGFDRADAELAAGASRLTLDIVSDGWASGARLVVSGGSHAEGRRVAAVTVESGRTVLDLDQPLDHAYPLAGTEVLGNVVTLTHGRSAGEQVAGSGDGSTRNQQFRTQKGPVSWVPDAEAPQGVSSTLSVIVDQERWTPVDTLAGSAPADHHYVEEQDEERRACVTGGDGRFGAAFPSGRDNIRVRYRVGSGREGNVRAGELTVMAQPLPFVARTFNPIDASGGADAESPDETRRRAGVWVRSFDRAVSTGDFALLAMRLPGIAKARADLVNDAGGSRLQLTVAANDGMALSPDLARVLEAAVASRGLAHLNVEIRDAVRVPIRLALEVVVRPSFLRAETQARVLAAVGNGRDHEGRPAYLSFERRGLGAPLYLSEIYAIVEQVRGVDHLVARAFHEEGSAAGIADRIHIPPTAYATGGDPTDPSIGLLHVAARGGLA